MPFARWIMSIGIAVVLVAVPFAHFRADYAHHKRLRPVAAGVLYRSGQLTAQGLRDAVVQYGCRTIINCQNEFPDPELPLTFWDRQTVAESEVCAVLGIRYVHLDPDLCPRRTDPSARPAVIGQFLAVLDDPSAWPVLLHCKAGLHRTGVLAAVYRMEYEGWGPHRALAELKAHGFGDTAATAANDYVQQYVLNYRPRKTEDRGQRSEVRGTAASFLPSARCPLSSVSQGGAP